MTTTILNSAARLAVLLAAGVLAACGSKESASPTAAAANKATASTARVNRGDATAEEVAREARGKVRCPPKLSTAARKNGAPVDDVVGVRPGLTYEEAANVVLCTNELLVVGEATSRGFQIQTYGQKLRQGFTAGFAKPRVDVQKTARDYRKEMQDRAIAVASNRARAGLQPGEARWYVATMGLPGQERVISAAREEWFEENRHPTRASVEQALIQKYGQPTEVADSGARHLTWAHDPFGRLITETSPLFRRCHAQASPDAGTSFSPDCGIVVAAAIHPLSDNPELSRYLQVSVVDQSGGYEALQATEQAFAQMEADRRAKQVEAAGKDAAAPTL